MAEIVDIKAWKGRKGAPTPPDTPATPAEAPSTRLLPEGFEEMLVKVTGASEKAGDMAKELKEAVSVFITLPLRLKERLERLIPRDERQIRGYQSLVRSYPNEQIKKFLEYPDKKIQKKPFFFYAIADEAERRGDI